MSPKRKPPPEGKIWARIAGSEWHINLPDGTTFTKSRDIDRPEAAKLATTLPVYLISYLSPVVDLTGDADAIEKELEKTTENVRLFGNTASVFSAPSGAQAVVFEGHH